MAYLLISTLVLVFSQGFLFIYMSELRLSRKFSFILTGIFCIAEALINTYLTYTSVNTNTSLLSFLSLTIPSLVYFAILSRYRGSRFLVTFCLADISVACAESLGVLLGLYAGFDLSSSGIFFIRIICEIGVVITIIFTVGKIYRNALISLDHGWYFLLPLYYLILINSNQ